MAGPWDDYSPPAAASMPWDDYKSASAGQDLGTKPAFYGGIVSGSIPFGNKVTAGLGAVTAGGIQGANQLMGNDVQDPQTIGQYYDQIRQNQAATESAHPAANLAGVGTGAVATLPIFGGIGDALAAGKFTAPVANYFGTPALAADSGLLSKTGALLTNMGKSAIAAAPVGAIYGAGSAPDGQELQGAQSGAKLAGIVGGAIPIAGAALSAIGNSIVPKIDPEIADLAQQAKNLGVPLSINQVANTPFRNLVQKLSQDLPFSGTNGFASKQGDAFNQAVANTFGADNLTPDGVNAAIGKISGLYDSALAGKTIDTSELAPKLDQIVNQSASEVPDDIVNVISKNAENIKNSIQDGTISGEKLSGLRSQLVSKMKSVDPQAKNAVSNMIDAIDDTAAPQIGEDGAQQLQQARLYWRNYKTVDPLLEKSTDGTISPSQLINRVAASPYIDASRTPTGTDDLVDLARIGKQFLPNLAGSDTASKALLIGGGGLGATAITNPAIGVPAALTAGAGLGANRAYQSLYNNSPGIVNSIVNRSLSNSPVMIPQIPPQSLNQIAAQVGGNQ